MKSTPTIAWPAVMLLAVVLALPSAQAQESKSAENGTAAQTKKKERAKPRGRLPAYFSRVVSATQREKIYSIQTKFQLQLVKLQTQLKELESQRDMEVHDVLTAEQKSKVAEYQAAAKKRRAKSTKSRKTAGQGPDVSTKR